MVLNLAKKFQIQRSESQPPHYVAVLFTDNMIDLEIQERIFFFYPAIFTTEIRPTGYLLPDSFTDLLTHAASIFLARALARGKSQFFNLQSTTIKVNFKQQVSQLLNIPTSQPLLSSSPPRGNVAPYTPDQLGDQAHRNDEHQQAQEFKEFF